jgi:hypothetical protein
LGRGGAFPLTQATGAAELFAGITQLIKATPGPGVFTNWSPPVALNVERMKAMFVADITPVPVGNTISESSHALTVPPPMKSSVPSMNTFLK